MEYTRVIKLIDELRTYKGGQYNLFLLPQDVMSDIYHLIVENKIRSCIELGTGFGSTACVIAAALEEIGGGKLVTVDRVLLQPLNVVKLMNHIGIDPNTIDVVTDNLGYNWYLPELIQKQTIRDKCEPIFDFCLLDGAHEWEPDALAFTLVSRLIKPGGLIAIDDINYRLRMSPHWEETHADYSARELDTYQMRMVYELVVMNHPEYSDFQITHQGRIGWARKFPND